MLCVVGVVCCVVVCVLIVDATLSCERSGFQKVLKYCVLCAVCSVLCVVCGVFACCVLCVGCVLCDVGCVLRVVCVCVLL